MIDEMCWQLRMTEDETLSSAYSFSKDESPQSIGLVKKNIKTLSVYVTSAHISITHNTPLTAFGAANRDVCILTQVCVSLGQC